MAYLKEFGGKHPCNECRIASISLTYSGPICIESSFVDDTILRFCFLYFAGLAEIGLTSFPGIPVREKKAWLHTPLVYIIICPPQFVFLNEILKITTNYLHLKFK
jgi:hypothetical protein